MREREHGALHELTTRLVRAFGNRFVVEDPAVRNLLENHSLARAISEQSWGAFVRLLTDNAEEAGGWVTKVPARFTSQRCSACGTLPERRLSRNERVFRCPSRSFEEDRDVNAARNILAVGLRAEGPGGDTPACRKEAPQRSVRSATTGVHRCDTEQHRAGRRAACPEPVNPEIDSPFVLGVHPVLDGGSATLGDGAGRFDRDFVKPSGNVIAGERRWMAAGLRPSLQPPTLSAPGPKAAAMHSVRCGAADEAAVLPSARLARRRRPTREDDRSLDVDTAGFTSLRARARSGRLGDDRARSRHRVPPGQPLNAFTEGALPTFLNRHRPCPFANGVADEKGRARSR